MIPINNSTLVAFYATAMVEAAPNLYGINRNDELFYSLTNENESLAYEIEEKSGVSMFALNYLMSALYCFGEYKRGHKFEYFIKILKVFEIVPDNELDKECKFESCLPIEIIERALKK